VQKSYTTAKAVLEEHLDVLHKLSEELLERETVMGEELDALILSLRPGFEFPSKHARHNEPDVHPAPQPPEGGAEETSEEKSEDDASDASENPAPESPDPSDKPD
jgi:cell division protease FtsH